MYEVSGIRAEVTPGSRIELRPLSMRANGDEWILGSVEAGEFIAVPAVAVQIVKLLGEGLTIGEVQSQLAAETGQCFAVGDFVVALDDAGFISTIDGEERRSLPASRPSLPWIKPKHVNFLLSPAFLFLVIALLIGALIALGFRHHATLSYRTLVWTRYSGLAISTGAAIGWLIIFLHELGHLVTARAAGAPARITLGTRLRFLVAQTDVSGIWAAPLRVRMVVYLAGLCIDSSIAISCLIILNYAHPTGVAGRLVALTSVEAFLMLPPQFMVFMRTDLYFVLQDLTKAPNLYADGLAYLRHAAMKLAPSLFLMRHGSATVVDDHALAPRRLVRIYAIVVLIGSTICIVTEFTISIPALIVIVVNGFREFRNGFIGAADGTAAVTVVGCVQILWAQAWWRRHGRRVLDWLHQTVS